MRIDITQDEIARCRDIVLSHCNGLLPDGTCFVAIDAYGRITAHYDEPWAEPDCHEGYQIEDENCDPVVVSTISGLSESEGFSLFRAGPYRV